MQKITFKNYPDTTTPINNTNLNLLQSNIEDAITDAVSGVMSDVSTDISTAVSNLKSLICPIGKIEMFFDNNDHSNYLGFTWERTSIGKVPVGIDSNDVDFDTIGETGGEKINSELHCGSTVWGLTNNTPGYMDRTIVRANAISHDHDEISASISNLQPYQVVAFWKRVS